MGWSTGAPADCRFDTRMVHQTFLSQFICRESTKILIIIIIMLFAFPAPVISRTFYFSTHHRNPLPVQHSPQQEEEAPRGRLASH